MQEGRSAQLDNAKALLIILVVWGHLIEPAALLGGANAGVYGAVYLFHIPAFVFISGMLTRPSQHRGDRASIWKRLLLPFALFQLLYWPLLALIEPRLIGGLLTPHWILWFLLSMIFWRLMLPLALRLPFPVMTTLAIALAAGFSEAIWYPLSLSRSLVFFPVFVFGHLYGRQAVARAAQMRLTGAAFFAGAMVLTIGAFYGQGDFKILYGSMPYACAPFEYAPPPLMRLLQLCAAIPLAAILIAHCPTKRSALTRIGERSLTVYLLHGALVLLLRASGVGITESIGATLAFLAANLLGAIVLSALLARLGDLDVYGWLIRAKRALKRPQSAH